MLVRHWNPHSLDGFRPLEEILCVYNKELSAASRSFLWTRKTKRYISLMTIQSCAHDGELWAENNPDVGAKIVVRIPLSQIGNGLSLLT
jgi:hypothetical protein